MSGSKDEIRKPEEDKESNIKSTIRKTFHTDFCQELSDLNRQVRMISDSLAACKQMSKRRMNSRFHADLRRRPHQSTVEVAINTSLTYKVVSQGSEEGIIPGETANGIELSPKKEDKGTVVSYMTLNKSPFNHLNKSAGFSTAAADPLLPYAETESVEDARNSSNSRRMECNRKSCERPSIVGFYDPEQVDSDKLINVILRELLILKEMVPSTTSKITELINVIVHYRVCAGCSRKFHGFIPQVLNRIQKLIKYVRKKRGSYYVWPNEYSYLKVTPKESPIYIVEETKRTTSADNSKIIELGRREELDVNLVDALPGIQIFLQVEPDKRKKRFYERVTSYQVKKNLVSREAYSVHHLKEVLYNPLVYVLRPSLSPRLNCKKTFGILCPKRFGLSVRFSPEAPKPKALAGLVRTPANSAGRFETSSLEFYLRGVAPFEERTLVQESNLVTVLLQQSEDTQAKEASDEAKGCPNLIEDSLVEVKDKNMQEQKVKDLEIEVKALKDLMLDVHRNQTELKKVLLEKGVYSPPIIKLTDPSMLDEESRAVKRASQMEEVPKRSTSAETLQVVVDELKKKCSVKNRMIVTLLKGLRSNVPKEWWEELVDCIFNETKPVEEFDSEKINQFIRQTSLYLRNGERATSTNLPPSAAFQDPLRSEVSPPVTEKSFRTAGLSSEVGKHSGVNPDEKNVVAPDSKVLQIWPNLGDVPFDSVGFELSTFPALVSGTTEFTIKKLENQIAHLNAENDKLWNQINDLKELLRQSRTNGSQRTNQTAAADVVTPSGRTVNLIIRIGQKSKDGRLLYVNQVIRKDVEDEGPSTLEPAPRSIEVSSPEECSNPKRYLEPKNPNDSDIGSEKSGRLRALLQSKLHNKPVPLADEVSGSTFDPSRCDVYDNRSLVRIPSAVNLLERSAPMAVDASEAGPSSGSAVSPPRKNLNLVYLPRTNSVTELTECLYPETYRMTTNERELQTIPENESEEPLPTKSSRRNVACVIQDLKSRVRSANKDVVLLKSQNDKMDKILGKILDGILENSDSIEKIGSDLSELKDRLRS